MLAETGVGAGDGSGAAFVAEADESDGSFLMFRPDAAVITCIEADHLDNYENLAQIEDAFLAFVGKISADGLLVIDADDPGTRKLAQVVEGGAAGRCGSCGTGSRRRPTTGLPGSGRTGCRRSSR